MKKGIFVTFFIVLLSMIIFLISRYYEMEYVEGNLYLTNGIVLHDEIFDIGQVEILQQIDFSGFSAPGEFPLHVTSISSVIFDDNLIGYQYMDLNDQNNRLYIRTQGKKMWTFQGGNCKGPGYPMPWRFVWKDRINIATIPLQLLDVVRMPSNDQMSIQGTGGNRITQTKRGP